VYLTNVVIGFVLLGVPPVQRLGLVHVCELSRLLQLLLLRELLEQLLVLELDLLVLLLQLLVLERHPLILHVQAHHIRLQLSQSLLQHS
jgi:hypothetical protein